jgi:hypothetical protein
MTYSPRIPWLGSIAILMVAMLLATSCQGGAGTPDEAARAARSFLSDLIAGRAEQAWQALTPATRQALYSDDESLFANDVQGSDWSGITWDITRPPVSRDISWAVFVDVDGGSSSLPDFLVSSGLVDVWEVAGADNVMTNKGLILSVQGVGGGNWQVAGVGLDR